MCVISSPSPPPPPPPPPPPQIIQMPEIQAPPPPPAPPVASKAPESVADAPRTNTIADIAARTQSLAIRRKRGKSSLRIPYTGSGMNYPA